MHPDPLESLDDRSRALPRAVKIRVGVGAAVILAVAAFAAAIAIGAFSHAGADENVPPVSITPVAAGGTEAPSGSGGGDGAKSSALYVHVLGSVARPGIYTLGTGSRVVDAIGAAGGLTDDADPAGVNLARPLADGEQLLVPRVGETAPPATATGGAGDTAASGGKINLNTATSEQLEQLPRVGPAMAQKIVRWREQNGRFTSIDDLMNVSGIGQKTFDGLKDSVTV